MNNTSKAESLRRCEKKRQEIFKRDSLTCQACQTTQGSLRLYSRRFLPATDPWNYPDKLLVTLCDSCLHYEADNQQRVLRMLQRAVQEIWLADQILGVASVLDCAASNPALDSRLIDRLIASVLLDPRVRQAALRAYIEAFGPFPAPFLNQLEAQLSADIKASSEVTRIAAACVQKKDVAKGGKNG